MSRRFILLTVVYLSLIHLCTAVDADKSKKDIVSGFSGVLSTLYELEALNTAKLLMHDRDSLQNLALLDHALMVDQDRNVPLEIVATNETIVQHVLFQAEEIGFVKTLVHHHIMMGKVPVLRLPDLALIPDLIVIRPITFIASAGSVQSESVSTMKVDDLRKQYPEIDGRGLKIGVMSIGYDQLNTANLDVKSGDLPSNVKVFYEGISNYPKDEGRAMMQLVYDVAPGAQLFFHTSAGGESGYASNIDQLVKAGCNVIVSDVAYYSEPMFQDGRVAQAVDRAVNSGVAFFSAAGNQASKSYTSPFIPSGQFNGKNEQLHQWQSGVSQFKMQLSGQVRFVLQWDQPFASIPGSNGSANDLNMYLYDQDNKLITSSESTNVGGDPDETMIYTLPKATYGLEIALHEGAVPGLMKIVLFMGDTDTNPFASLSADVTSGSTIYGHANAEFVAAIGASDAQKFNYPQQVPVIESSSSRGGTPILFNYKGERLSQPKIRQQPLVVGPDGITNTFFPNTTLPVFYGTSAAVSNVAGVALLMLQAKPDLKPQEIYKLLGNTAIDMDDPSTAEFDKGFDWQTGYGYINARAALNAILSPTSFPAPTISPVKVTKVTRAPLSVPSPPIKATRSPVMPPRSYAPVQSQIPPYRPSPATIRRRYRRRRRYRNPQQNKEIKKSKKSDKSMKRKQKGSQSRKGSRGQVNVDKANIHLFEGAMMDRPRLGFM
jgi:hypothetical protein